MKKGIKVNLSVNHHHHFLFLVDVQVFNLQIETQLYEKEESERRKIFTLKKSKLFTPSDIY